MQLQLHTRTPIAYFTMPLSPTYTALVVVLPNGSEAYELNVTAVVLQEAFVASPFATFYWGSSGATQSVSCSGACDASSFDQSGYSYSWPTCAQCVATILVSPALDGASLWYTFSGTVSGTSFNVSSNSTQFNYTAAFLSTHIHFSLFDFILDSIVNRNMDSS